MMNKTCLFFVLFSSLLFQTQGQNDTINRTTTDGLKYGFWQEYFQNGNIKTEGEYKIFKQPFSEEELFFFGITNPDSLHSRSIKTGLWNEYNIHGEKIRSEFYKNGIQVYSEQYIYDENGKFLKKINNIPSHRYANKKDFKINPLFIDQIGPIGSRKIIYLKIESLSDTLTEVILIPSSKNISLLFSTYMIEPYTSLSIPVLYLLKQGVHRDTLLVRLINFETYNHNVIIESYGYTLTSSNLQNSDDNLNTYLINSEK